MRLYDPMTPPIVTVARQQDGGGKGQVQQPAAGPGLGGLGHAA